jgi:hypothetical protein
LKNPDLRRFGVPETFDRLSIVLSESEGLGLRPFSVVDTASVEHGVSRNVGVFDFSLSTSRSVPLLLVCRTPVIALS